MSVEAIRLPGWPSNVQMFYTTRTGGNSAEPYAGLNLGLHVGDREESVLKNREQLLGHLPAKSQVAWLDQVHGTNIVPAIKSLREPLRADGCWTRAPAIACAVMVADCLPVLLCDRKGSTVAAVHAGWRGLAAGVLESAVSAMDIAPKDLLAWLGPAISKRRFEVGPEVKSALTQDIAPPTGDAFFSACPSNPGHYFADLPALAQQRLRALGLSDVRCLNACTASDPERFFSYRRDGVTGRMACLILRSS